MEEAFNNITVNTTTINITTVNITTINTTTINTTTLGHASIISDVISGTVFSIGLPTILLAIYALYFLIRADHIAPVYVINLLISDLIQICMIPIRLAGYLPIAVSLVNFFGLTASVGFMVCIALERYLVIAFPLWYRFRRNLKYSLIISSIVWLFPFIQIALFSATPSVESSYILLSVFLLVPFPLLVFFVIGTVKALSVSISVPPIERKRIIGTLALVLCNYTLLFLPTIIQHLVSGVTNHEDVKVGNILVQFSPLVDPLLYVFMRRGAKDTLLAFPSCFTRMRSDQQQSQGTTMTDMGGDSSV